MMAKKQTFFVWTCTILLFTLMVAGCQQKEAEPSIIPLDDDIPRNQPVIDEENPNSPETADEPTENNKNDTSISSEPEDEDQVTNGPTLNDNDGITNNQSEDFNYEVTVSYTPSNPALMGFMINESKDKIISELGNPFHQYVMEDEIDPITVYDYQGFLIGFNKHNQVVFIDVTSNQVNPGLNGLKLGSTVEEAIDALGNPDSNTEFVINYISEEVILKLDVDPTTSKISSIKLFGRN